MKKYVVALMAALLTACGGGGGGSSAPSNPTTPSNPSTPTSPSNPSNPSTPSNPSQPAAPLPVQKSSYLNKVTAANAIGPQALPAEVGAGNAVAFADFFQDGTYSMVTHACGDSTASCNGNGSGGAIHFYKNVNGSWVDHTADILSNTVGCLHPRKAIVADFNGDGKPDVFFACHGLDVAPFPGEQPHILLSQANGQYSNVTLPFTGYFHSASAADFSGNGHADIVVTDMGSPFFLKNNGDGTFTKDTARLACADCTNKQIYTTELIDFNNTGKFDLFLAGTAPDGNVANPNPFIPTIFKNNGDNTFSQTNETQLPYNAQYETTLDVLVVNGVIYTTNVHLTYDAAVYGHSDIEKIVNGTATQLYVGTASYAGGAGWINWIIPFQGKITSLNSSYDVSVAQ